MITNSMITYKRNQFIALDRIDESLDKWTPYFGISTLTGVCKLVMGTIEAISGTVAMIFFAIGRVFSQSSGYYSNIGAIHCLNGMKNMLKGTLVAIPFMNLAVDIYDGDTYGIKGFREGMFAGYIKTLSCKGLIAVQ